MAEEKINTNEWQGVELADAVGMVTNQVSAPNNSAQLIKNLQTHRKLGALRVRPGYSLKYAVPTDANDTITGHSFLNFDTFYDKQTLSTGQEVTCLISKGTINAVSGSGVADTQNQLNFWIRPYWDGDEWIDSWQWLNQTIITNIIVASDSTYPNMIYTYGLTGLANGALVGWTIYNKTKNQFARIITSVVSGGATRICHTAYESSWEEGDTVFLIKNYVDLTAMSELYTVAWDEIQFHKILNDIKIGFGGKTDRPGLTIGYRKKYLMLAQTDFTNLHADITTAAITAFATINEVVLDTCVADKNAYGIDLTSVVGTLAADTYYFRLTGLIDGYEEQLLAENQITVSGGDDDIEIYPFAYINKLNPRITQLNIYRSTDNTTFYKIKENPIRVDEYLQTTWKINEQGKLIFIKDSDLIVDQNAATPTTDFNSIGNWVAKDTYGCSFVSEDDDVGQVSGLSISIASPCVITKTNHGLADGQKIKIYTTGSLPTGITAGGDYFVKFVDVSTFKITATQGGADINTSGTQSGSHYLYGGLRTPQNGSYFLLWQNIQHFSMIMKLESPVITYTAQRCSVSFYAKTNVSGIILKIGSISPYPNPFGDGETPTEYQEVTLSNDGSWHLHSVTLNIYGKLVLEAPADSLGNTITRIGIDNVVIQPADYLSGSLTNGTEMKSEMGYAPTFNVVKGWDQALVFRGRCYYLNPYVEKRYDNYILVSMIHSSGAYMYDIAAFSNFRELEKSDSDKTKGMALLPTTELLILKNKSITSIDPDTGAMREPKYGVSCVSLNSIVNINGIIFWAGEDDFYVLNINKGFSAEGILGKTIRDLYLAITDKTKIQGIRDKFNTYLMRTLQVDSGSKTIDYHLTENGWNQEVKNLLPAIYRQGETYLYFMNSGNIYQVEDTN